MSSVERLHYMQRLLRERGRFTRAEVIARFEISHATFKRDLDYLRDRLGTPVVWDRAHNWYRLDAAGSGGPLHELPGLWFSVVELKALLTMHALLERIEPGLLPSYVAPLRERIEGMLKSEGESSAVSEAERLRLLSVRARSVDVESFRRVTQALLERRRLSIRFYSRKRDVERERVVSPQRVVYYRDNWYLEAWCHLKRGLRIFSLNGIRAARVVNEAAKEIPTQELDAHMRSGFGIFAGRETQTARLRFTPERARWTAHESWHPKQRGAFDAEGYYVLEIPYADDRELLLDILRYGPDVEVQAPPELRARVIERLHAAVQVYAEGD